MKSTRSSFALILSTFGAFVLLANCTVKSVDDPGETDGGCKKGAVRSGCDCPGNGVGSQTCGSDGKYGSCECAGGSGGTSSNTGGTSSNTGGTSSNMGGDGSTNKAGTSSTAGKSTGGTSAAGGAGGEGVSAAGEGGVGQGGEAAIDPTDCESCLAQLCPTEWDACNNDPNCISPNVDGTGQYEKIMIDCVGSERVNGNGVVTRDKVRGCGFTMGVSSDPNTIDV